MPLLTQLGLDYPLSIIPLPLGCPGLKFWTLYKCLNKLQKLFEETGLVVATVLTKRWIESHMHTPAHVQINLCEQKIAHADRYLIPHMLFLKVNLLWHIWFFAILPLFFPSYFSFFFTFYWLFSFYLQTLRTYVTNLR